LLFTLEAWGQLVSQVAVAVGMEGVMQGLMVVQVEAVALRMYVLGAMDWPTELLLPEVGAVQDAAVSKQAQEEGSMGTTEAVEEEPKAQVEEEIIQVP